MRSYASGICIAADSFIDLQTHTHLSDGKWTPELLIDYFVAEGFGAAAITDHDRVDNIAEIQRIALERDFPLVVAVEMTTRWRNHLVDILCFGFEDNIAPIQMLCDEIRTAQIDISKQVYKNLVASGHIPRYDIRELTTLIEAPTARQPYLLFDLLFHYTPNIQDEMTLMKSVGYKLCTNPTQAVINAVHECGGVAVIAHPGRTDGYATFDETLLDEFQTEIPIDGIEAYYPRHTSAQVELYLKYAQKHQWLISAGSDSHTPNEPPIKYMAKQCVELLKRLGIRVVD